YFKRSEEFDGSPLAYAADDLAYHGNTGQMHVRPVPDPTPFTAAFIDAARDLGYGGGLPHWDFNGRQQENGAGLFQVTVTADRKRVSTARAFLADAATRPRLPVVLDAVVIRVRGAAAPKAWGPGAPFPRRARHPPAPARRARRGRQPGAARAQARRGRR